MKVDDFRFGENPKLFFLMTLVWRPIFGGNGNGRSWPVVAGQKRPGAAKIDFDNLRKGTALQEQTEVTEEKDTTRKTEARTEPGFNRWPIADAKPIANSQ